MFSRSNTTSEGHNRVTRVRLIRVSSLSKWTRKEIFSRFALEQVYLHSSSLWHPSTRLPMEVVNLKKATVICLYLSVGPVRRSKGRWCRSLYRPSILRSHPPPIGHQLDHHDDGREHHLETLHSDHSRPRYKNQYPIGCGFYDCTCVRAYLWEMRRIFIIILECAMKESQGEW